MKKPYFLIILLSLLFAGSMGGCISDSISTSSTDILSFSRDTVNFDTVFTGVGTPTARLIAFNRAKKGIEISSIRLAGGDDSRFQINVDGVSGKTFHDVEVRGNDSIYIFIECFPPENSSSQPYLISDRLLFTTNGVEQAVELEAYGQNVTRLRGVCISEDTRFTSECPYVVSDSLVVEKGATLFIDPEVQLLFHDGAVMTVRGRLEAVGMPGRMIRMRGDRLDNVLPDVGYEILAGQWGGVRIDPASFDNRLEYVDMQSTVSGLVADSCGDLSRSKVILRNSWLHNSRGNALRADYCKIDAYGCCFSESADAVVLLKGGDHLFEQCTVANNYLFSAISQPLLTLLHALPKENDPNRQPYMKMNFTNGIIYGLAADLNEGDFSGSEVYFRNVLLKSKGDDDDNFISCLWDSDPLFLTRRSDYYFNYHVEPDSPAVGAGNPAYVSPAALIDIDGVNRLSTGNPTLGAYARPEEEE